MSNSVRTKEYWVEFEAEHRNRPAADYWDTAEAGNRYHSNRNRQRLKEKRERDAAKRQANPRQCSADELSSLKTILERRDSRAALIELRRTKGALWPGGGVGGNPMYALPRTVYPGLVSAEAGVLQRFVQATPRAGMRGKNKLLTGKDKGAVSQGDSKLLALDEEYVYGNSIMRGFFRVDLDGDFLSFAALREAIAAAGVQQPHIIQGFIRNGRLLNPHLVWLLHNPVCFAPRASGKAKTRWWNVLRGLVFALRHLGADPGGLSNAMKTKNPVCPWWHRDVYDGEPAYLLNQIAEGIRTDVSDDELGLKSPEIVAGKYEELLKHSNGLFHALNAFTRAIIADRRAIGCELDEFRAEVVQKSLGWAESTGRTERQAGAVGIKVAEYVWGEACRVPLTAEEIREARVQAGKDSAAKKLDKNLNAILTAYKAIVAAGGKATKAAVRRASGLSEKTVERRWYSVLAAVHGDDENTVIRSPNDKKGAEPKSTETTTVLEPTTLPLETDGTAGVTNFEVVVYPASTVDSSAVDRTHGQDIVEILLRASYSEISGSSAVSGHRNPFGPPRGLSGDFLMPSPANTESGFHSIGIRFGKTASG